MTRGHFRQAAVIKGKETRECPRTALKASSWLVIGAFRACWGVQLPRERRANSQDPAALAVVVDQEDGVRRRHRPRLRSARSPVSSSSSQAEGPEGLAAAEVTVAQVERTPPEQRGAGVVP